MTDFGQKARPVKSSSSPQPHVVQTKSSNRHHYICDSNCPMFKGFSLCSHVVAVAEVLPIFLSSIKKGCKPNLSAIAMHGMPGGSGRKGGVPKRKRKSTTPIASRSVRQCFHSSSDLPLATGAPYHSSMAVGSATPMASIAPSHSHVAADGHSVMATPSTHPLLLSHSAMTTTFPLHPPVMATGLPSHSAVAPSHSTVAAGAPSHSAAATSAPSHSAAATSAPSHSAAATSAPSHLLMTSSVPSHSAVANSPTSHSLMASLSLSCGYWSSFSLRCGY